MCKPNEALAKIIADEHDLSKYETVTFNVPDSKGNNNEFIRSLSEREVMELYGGYDG